MADAVACPVWAVIAAAGAATVLSFAILAEYFPKEISGRANAALNLLHVGGAFVLQSATGLIIAQWPQTNGGYAVAAHEAAMTAGICVQLLALGWFALPRRGALLERYATMTAARYAAIPLRQHERLLRQHAVSWRVAAAASTILCTGLSTALWAAATAARSNPIQVFAAEQPILASAWGQDLYRHRWVGCQCLRNAARALRRPRGTHDGGVTPICAAAATTLKWRDLECHGPNRNHHHSAIADNRVRSKVRVQPRITSGDATTMPSGYLVPKTMPALYLGNDDEFWSIKTVSQKRDCPVHRSTDTSRVISFRHAVASVLVGSHGWRQRCCPGCRVGLVLARLREFHPDSRRQVSRRSEPVCHSTEGGSAAARLDGSRHHGPLTGSAEASFYSGCVRNQSFSAFLGTLGQKSVAL